MKNLRDFLKVSLGWILYVLTDKNFPFSYRAMVALFCRTQGRSNYWQQKMISFFQPNEPFEETSGVLGTLSSKQVDQVIDSLRRDGYAVFPKAVSKEICRRVLEFSLETPALIRPSDEDLKKNPEMKYALKTYRRGEAEGIRYTFQQSDYLKNPDIQNLITDPNFIAIAGRYLGSEPALDILDMWWHTDYSSVPDANAAQLYHFDMDRVKWLKFFVYFTDVDTKTGPHCFVRGSHRPSAMPPEILNKGYARLQDEEVLRYFSKEDLIEHLAESGTIIAEDTCGLHKGKHVLKGDRLVMNIQYSSTFFGTPDNHHFQMPASEIRSEKALREMEKKPSIYRKYFDLEAR